MKVTINIASHFGGKSIDIKVDAANAETTEQLTKVATACAEEILKTNADLIAGKRIAGPKTTVTIP